VSLADDSDMRAARAIEDQSDWVFLVSTAAGGLAVCVDIAFFRHRHMEAAGIVGMLTAFVIMTSLTIVQYRKGIYRWQKTK